ncbi:MAG: sigma-70 family RNA polymerase sigma factor [Dysgonamonadaceae bacterium]|nr:sigma-70 family RNA polymerase sigma factor [Dysgonamonadaceae bacterium]
MEKNNKITTLGNDELFVLFQKNGSPVYFGELYRRYIPLLYGLCLKYLGKEEDAQDAVMDIFEGLADKVRRYDIKNFHTWLYSVAKNHCLQRLRNEKRAVFVNIDESVMENGNFFTLLDTEQTDDEKSALDYCMKKLNEEQHNSINLFYFEEKSYADIVTLTGYPLEKVKSYIQNGKRNLKNCIVTFLQNNELIVHNGF